MTANASPYLSFKIAQAMFGKMPDSLAPAERLRVGAVVAHQIDIEDRILSASEAVGGVLQPGAIDGALDELRSRYDTDAAFERAIAGAGLDRERLRDGIERSLRVDAVLDRVGGAVEVSETEVELFYLLHPERFIKPEQRTLRHILITINEALKGNCRAMARWRIDTVLRRLVRSPDRFEALAVRFSECPTALNGGLIGTVRRGQLYPELEKVAFALDPGQLSGVVETENGFHVVHCVCVEPAGRLSLAEATARIRDYLGQSKRQAVQKAWIESLIGKAS